MSFVPESGALVASIPHLVETMMERLSAKQLNTCAHVCSLWREIANTIKARRLRVQCYCFYFCHEDMFEETHYSACYPKRKNVDCISPFLFHLNNLASEPSFALVFCSKAMVHRSRYFFPFFRAEKRKLEDNSDDDEEVVEIPHHRVFGSLYPFFPRTCEVGFCTAPGVSRISFGLSEFCHMISCPSLAIVYFPTIPGVNIYRFSLSLRGFKCTTPVDASCLTGIPEDEPVQCLLYFLHEEIGDFPCKPYNKIIGHYLEQQNWKMAFGGIFVDHMFFPKHESRRRNQCYGIAFTGENVQALSVVLTEDMDTEEKIERQFKLIADNDVLKGHCVAFIFTCVLRVANYYERNDFERSIFEKLFPHIPLIGIFGSRVIGLNYIPQRKCKQVKRHGSWMRNYLSVLVVISVNV